MDCETPEMFEMVAVGATAMTLEFLIPCSATAFLTGSQSRVAVRSISTGTPRSSSRRSIVSMGRSPRLHFDPS
jgi:hypothetical protein